MENTAKIVGSAVLLRLRQNGDSLQLETLDGSEIIARVAGSVDDSGVREQPMCSATAAWGRELDILVR